MLTCNQYEGGYYSAREASVIATTFSAVSITFSIVVLSQVDLMQYFGVYYLLICLIGVVLSLIHIFNQDLMIVFVTGYTDYVFDGYKVGALDYRCV